ncbi:MAG: Hsp20/alpha crystallin family protein [Armatimonas sp.]
MQLVRFDPLREMERLHNDLNRLFEGAQSTDSRADRSWAPAVDVAETEDALYVRAEVPGMSRDDIDIELSGETLTLRGERKFESEDKKDNFVRIERRYGKFSRSFTLATPIQIDKVSANYRDGILEIVLPKSEETKPRKVQVIAG